MAISPVSSVSSLPYLVPCGFHAVPLLLSPCPPRFLILSLLARMLPFSVTTYTRVNTNTHTREAAIFCCQNRKFGNAGTRLICARSTKSREWILRFCSRGRISSLQERSRSERKISLGVSIPGRRKLVTAAASTSATGRISPFNGTGQDDLVTPVRATRASCIQMRSALTRRASQFRDFLLTDAPVRSRLVCETPLPSGGPAFRREGTFLS